MKNATSFLLLTMILSACVFAQTTSDANHIAIPGDMIIDVNGQVLPAIPQTPGYRLQEIFCEFHEITNMTWQNSSNDFYTYVSGTNVDSLLSRKWFNDEWYDYRLTTYVYDPSTGLRTHYLLQESDGNNWVNLTQILTEYNASNLVDTSTTQSWDETHWDNVRRNVFIYDNSGRVSEGLIQSWDINQWADMSNTLYYFQGNGTRLDSLITFSWTGSSWSQQSKTSYIYDASNRRDRVVTQIWSGGNWFNSTQLVYAYNGAGQETEVLFQQWDNVSSWNDFSHALYTYDVNGNQETELNQWWISNAWVNNTRCTNTWESAVGIDDSPYIAEAFHLNNYPNPFNPVTMIEFQLPVASRVTLTIHDILGRYVTTPYRASLPAGNNKFVWDGRDANGNPAASGVYFYRLQAGDVVQTRKMLLIR